MRSIFFVLFCLVVITVCALPLSPAVVEATEASGVTSGYIYTLQNVGSGKYLNVDNGRDADNVNVYQYTGYDLAQQKFRLIYDASQAAYRIRPVYSDRVLDIVKSGGSVTNGCNVQIYSAVDNVAQLWKISSIGNGRYKIVPKYNTAVALTSNGMDNGTYNGTSPTSPGNVYLSTISGDGTLNQQWSLTLVGYPSVSYYSGLGWTYMYSNSYDYSRISSGYKLPTRPDHYGIDIVGRSTSTPIDGVQVANVYAGYVLVSQYSSSAGNYVCVETNSYDPVTSRKLVARYLHLKELPYVSTGPISQSTIIGRTGSTGISTGPHLHFDVNNDRRLSALPSYVTINPERFFTSVSFTGDVSSINY